MVVRVLAAARRWAHLPSIPQLDADAVEQAAAGGAWIIDGRDRTAFSTQASDEVGRVATGLTMDRTRAVGQEPGLGTVPPLRAGLAADAGRSSSRRDRPEGSDPIGQESPTVRCQSGITMRHEGPLFDGFITRADLRQAAQDVPALAPIFLDPNYDLANGDTNITSPAGCRLWDVGIADPVQHKPVASAIPTLVLAGEYDIGVLPFIVRQIPPTLPNSFFYEFPAGAHGQLASYNNDSECARSIAAQFLKEPRVRPNAACIASLPPFDFTP